MAPAPKPAGVRRSQKVSALPAPGAPHGGQQPEAPWPRCVLLPVARARSQHGSHRVTVEVRPAAAPGQRLWETPDPSLCPAGGSGLSSVVLAGLRVPSPHAGDVSLRLCETPRGHRAAQDLLLSAPRPRLRVLRPSPRSPQGCSRPGSGSVERGAQSDPPRCLLRCSLEKSWSLVLPGASVGRLSSPCWTVKGPEDGSADFPSPFLPAVSLAPSSRSPE